MTSSWLLLLPLALALAPRSAGALAAPRLQPGPRRPIALIKQDRCASSLLFRKLAAAICGSPEECRKLGKIKPEVFNHLKGQRYSDVRDQAKLLLEKSLSCDEGTSCGLVSLSLQKMSGFGYADTSSAASTDLVQEILAHGASVIFLTRRNCFAQAVSSVVAQMRNVFMRSAAIDVHGECDAWHLYKCPRETQSLVKNITFHVDVNALVWQVRSCEDFRRLYSDFDHKLRRENHRHNLSIQSVSYEDLMMPRTWRSIYDSLHLQGEIPEMVNSTGEYRHTIDNFDELSQKATAMGYERAA